MTADADARRIASGSPPSQLVPATSAAEPVASPQPATATAAPYDPLRLCIFATIALLGWLAGPVALVVFAAIGFAGYWKAWRGGLRTSKCFLRDTRLVLAYFLVLGTAGGFGTYALVASLLGG